jgi:ubiquinone/menaquinone biosynthesis C-methylase UbiE
LDLGCGTGHFCEDLTRKGASVIGIDKSNEFIKVAKENAAKEKLNIRYLHLNGAKMPQIPTNSIDKAFMFQVVMNVPSINEMRGIFKEIGRVVKKKGELIFSTQHILLLRTYHDNLRKITLPKNFSYYKSGSGYTIKKKLTDKSWMTFHNTHWSLEFLSSLLAENGFVITQIEEPAPKNRTGYLKGLDAAPEYIFIKARKL